MSRSDSDPRYTLGYGEGAMAWMEARTADRHGAFLLPYLKPGMTLLDCGCGPGTLTVGFAERVAPGRVIGVDREIRQTAASRQRAAELGLEHLEFQPGDLNALPFDNDSFDVVFCSAVIGSVSDPDRVAGEMGRVLKPGGLLAMKEFDHGGDMVYPSSPAITRSIELYQRIRAHNGHEAHGGMRVKGLIGAQGCDIEYLQALYDGHYTEAGLRWFIERNNDLVDEVLAEQYEALGWATRAELAEHARAWRDFAVDPSAIYMAAWVEAIGRKR